MSDENRTNEAPQGAPGPERSSAPGRDGERSSERSGDRGDYRGGGERGGERGGDDRGGRPPMNRGRGGRGFFRKKVCRFCTQGYTVDYKNPEGMRRFVTERGKILPRRITGTCAKHQRMLAREIKKARVIALLPYVKK